MKYFKILLALLLIYSGYLTYEIHSLKKDNAEFVKALAIQTELNNATLEFNTHVTEAIKNLYRK